MSCFLELPISFERYKELHNRGLLLISSECGTGVAPNKVSLVGCENGFTVYEQVIQKS